MSNLVPMVIQNTPGGERAMDIYSRLLVDNIIMFSGGVDSGSAQIAVSQLLYLESVNPDRDIIMYVDSPGGSCSAGLSIIDTMNYIKNDVVTVVTGMAASMGSLIATSGAPGKRFMLPHAEHLIHQPMGGLGSGTQQSDFEIHAAWIKRIRHNLEKVYEKTNSKGKTQKQIHNAIERDNIMSAEECIEFGLADKIISSRNDI